MRKVRHINIHKSSMTWSSSIPFTSFCKCKMLWLFLTSKHVLVLGARSSSSKHNSTSCFKNNASSCSKHNFSSSFKCFSYSHVPLRAKIIWLKMSMKCVLDIDAHYNDHTSKIVAWSKHMLELRHQMSLMSSTFQAFKNV